MNDHQKALCGQCEAEVGDGAWLCTRCTVDLERDLGDVTGIVNDLEISYTRQVRLGSRVGARSVDTPVPYNAKAGVLLEQLRNSLSTWVRDVLEDNIQLAGPTCRACAHPSCAATRRRQGPGDGLPAMAQWLLVRINVLRHHRQVVDLAQDISDVLEKARLLVDRPADRWYAGPCDCGYELWVEANASGVRCEACDTVHVVEKRREWLLAEAKDRLATASVIAAALTTFGAECTPDRIWKWAQRGRLLSHGRDGQGRPLYRVGDVDELLATQTRRRERAS